MASNHYTTFSWPTYIYTVLQQIHSPKFLKRCSFLRYCNRFLLEKLSKMYIGYCQRQSQLPFWCKTFATPGGKSGANLGAENKDCIMNQSLESAGFHLLLYSIIFRCTSISCTEHPDWLTRQNLKSDGWRALLGESEFTQTHSLVKTSSYFCGRRLFPSQKVVPNGDSPVMASRSTRLPIY